MAENESETPPKRSKPDLSKSEMAEIERNRQLAMERRSKRLLTVPTEGVSKDSSVVKMSGVKFVDSGGGFLIEESLGSKNSSSKTSTSIPPEKESIELPITYKECMECSEKFPFSYLWDNFQYAVCDSCRDPDDKHSLITKTEAKQEYLLKDCDLDKREPILKFILRANPHNVRWGEMKLYLHIQIEERALQVWGSEENLLNERELRDSKRETTKVKKYNKQLKKLRMNVRSSLYDKTKEAFHTHAYGDENYNEEDDIYSHTCISCGFVETFEKM